MQKTIKLAKFDATLNTDPCTARINADLTVALRVGFRQINPAAGAATGTYNDYNDPTATARKIVPWDAVSWTAWKTNFCSSAERFWDGKFWLLNHRGAFAYKVGEQVFVPNLACKFILTGADAGVGLHHHVIDVVRLDPTETWFGSHSTLYDNLDTQSVAKGTDSAGKPIMQQAHVHEVGHLLGIGHVDIGKAHCPATGDTNAAACYGVADFDKNSVMGQGMQLRDAHAQPWMTAFEQFVTEAAAIPLPAPIYTPAPAHVKAVAPYLQVQYPRTTAEFEAGTMNLILPAGR